MKQDFDQKLAMKLFKEGKGWREIARELGGIHPYSVQWWFKSQGLELKKEEKKPLDIEKAMELRANNYSIRDIAKTLDTSYSVIQKLFRISFQCKRCGWIGKKPFIRFSMNHNTTLFCPSCREKDNILQPVIQ